MGISSSFFFIGSKVPVRLQLVNGIRLCYFEHMLDYFTWIQRVTEARLTRRLQRIAREQAARKQKRTFKGELLSWLDAILFAVIAVLLINQYLFQLFLIPSPSMMDTLLIKDRVFVSKTAYGIETYPGGPKIFNSKAPLRDDVIVFYNPQYESRGRCSMFSRRSSIWRHSHW